jgi:hypothetical protein
MLDYGVIATSSSRRWSVLVVVCVCLCYCEEAMLYLDLPLSIPSLNSIFAGERVHESEVSVNARLTLEQNT